MSLAFPIERPLTRAIGSSVRWGRRPIWTPAALFAQGRQGVWYEPKPQYLYQDAAGTVPVVDGDPVGLMLDLSGNGHHATQSADLARPIYRTDGVLHWLEFDGVDDYLKAAPPGYTLTSLFCAVAGNANEVGVRGLFKSGDSDLGRSDSFILFRPAGSTSGLWLPPDDSTLSFGIGVGEDFIVSMDYDGAVNRFRRDGSVTKSEALQGSLTLSQDFVIGRSDTEVGNQFWSGGFFGLIFRGGMTSESGVSLAESYLANLAGIQL